MSTSKLYQTLALLKPAEHKSFRRFLQSPYHNRDPRLVQLFDILGKHLYHEKPRLIDETEAAAQMFPGEPFDQNRYRKLGTALLQVTLAFFRQEAFREDTVRAELYLTRRLNVEQADRFLPRQLERLQDTLEMQHLPPEERADLALAARFEAYGFESRQAGRRPQTRPDQMIALLEESYTIRKMKLLYMQFNHFRITGEGTEPDAAAFLEKLLPRLSQLPLKARLYYHLYGCSVDPDRETAYRDLRTLLGKEGGKLDAEDAMDIYNGVLNHCARQINRGKPSYLQETFRVYQEILGIALMERTSGLLKAHFKNLMTVAARMGQFAWAEEFLYENADRITGEYKENGLHYGHGLVAYYRAELDEAARRFHRVLDDYEDIYFALDARVYLLRVYYESENTVGLDALLDSFRMFLKRNKRMPRGRKANYNHFMNYLRRLSRIPEFEKGRMEKLRADILAGRRISATPWLIRMVDKRIKK